jgi:hypothetical protein
VRSAAAGKEVRLKPYEDFQDPRLIEEQVFAEGLKKVSRYLQEYNSIDVEG